MKRVKQIIGIQSINAAYELLVTMLERKYDNVEINDVVKQNERYLISFKAEKDGGESLVMASISDSDIIIQF